MRKEQISAATKARHRLLAFLLARRDSESIVVA